MKKGWHTKTIGDVCEFQRGLTYAKSDEVDVSDNVVLRATNIDLATNLLIFDELKYISDKVVVPESKKVTKGSLMICMASGSKSHLGKVAFIDEDYGYAFGGFMGMLTPLNGLLPRYLFHLMTSEDYKDFIGALSDGANINNLTFDKLKPFPVPVPPLAEQQRIIGLLDKAFDGLATAKANAEKNFKNARALFESHLQSVFTKSGHGWVATRLDALYKIGSSKRVLKSEWAAEGVPFYRGREVTRLAADGFVDNELFVSEAHFAELSKQYGVPEAGDIVITAIGTIGNAYVVRSSDRFYFKDASVLWMKRTAEVNSAFVRFWLKSSLFFDQLDRGNGATVDTLTINKLQSIELRLPPLDEQHRVAIELDAMAEETHRLARIYEERLGALEALKKSLLHHAFTGQL